MRANVLKILVVDDNIPTLELITNVLATVGVNVRALGDSQEAATLVSKEKFDGIFLDLVMPKVDGFELADRIRQSARNRRTPIVIVTGLEDKQTLRRAFAAGGTFFLQKPLSKDKLIHLLNSTRGAMLQERRRSKRIPLRTEVTCQVGTRQFTATSCNLNQSGILLEADGSLESGNPIQLSFQLPGQTRPIEATGVIVRLGDPQRLAVEFTYISVSDRQRIGDFVASIEQEEAENAP